MVAPDRGAETMKHIRETGRIVRHGSPKNFSADREFCRPVLQLLLETHAIKMADRRSRPPHKNGIVERNIGTFKEVFKISLPSAVPNLQRQWWIGPLSSPTYYMDHQYSDTSNWLGGYSPSILGMPTSNYPAELLQDCVVQHLKSGYDHQPSLMCILCEQMFSQKLFRCYWSSLKTNTEKRKPKISC